MWLTELFESTIHYEGNYDGNCVAIAFKYASGLDYHRIHEVCLKYGWSSRLGVKPNKFDAIGRELGLEVTGPILDAVYERKLRNGFSVLNRKTLRQVVEELSVSPGIYLICTVGHTMALVNGKLFDHNSTGMKSKVRLVYKVEQKPQINELEKVPADINNWRKDPKATKRVLSQYLRKYGFEEIGAGLSARVYKHPKRGVLKVFTNDPRYVKWVKWGLLHQSNPYVPRFKSKLIKFQNLWAYDIRSYGILIEELTPLETEEDIAFYLRVKDYVRGYNNLPHDQIEQDPNLKEVLDWIKTLNTDDLTDQNIMKRGNQYVFTDPV